MGRHGCDAGIRAIRVDGVIYAWHYTSITVLGSSIYRYILVYTHAGIYRYRVLLVLSNYQHQSTGTGS